MKTNICHVCGKEIISDGIGTGYGINKDNNKVCYSCCGLQDEKQLIENGSLCGYFHKDREDGRMYFTNWPGTLKIHVYYTKYSYHNFAGINGRVDFWFTYKNMNFWGYCISPKYNEIAHVKKSKVMTEKRCKSCGKLLLKSAGKDYHIETICPRCKSINNFKNTEK